MNKKGNSHPPFVKLFQISLAHDFSPQRQFKQILLSVIELISFSPMRKSLDLNYKRLI